MSGTEKPMNSPILRNERGAPIHLVQATLGHASVATTGRYLHARPTDSSSRYFGGVTERMALSIRKLAAGDLAGHREVSVTCRGCGRTPGSRRRLHDLSSFDQASNTYWCGRCSDPGALVELHCRRCPATSRQRRGDCGALVSYDNKTETYLCSECRQIERRVEPIDLRCRRCGKQPKRKILPERLKHLRSAKWREGQPTYLCLRCAGRENARTMRRRLLATYGVTAGDTEDVRLEAMRAHVELHMRPSARSKTLVVARAAIRERGVSDKARTQWSLGHFVKEQRAGEWRLCPLCRKVHYLSPQEAAEGKPGMHNSCYRQFAQSEIYRDWRRKVGSMRSPHLRVLLKRFPFPVPAPPRGRPPTSVHLDRNFRWTLRHFYFGESWREIAERENYTHGSIQHGVQIFIGLLPETWLEVFPDPRQGRRLEAALPVAQLRAVTGIA
jgi:hypothetical protein